MGNFINDLERKYGKYAIPEMTKIIIITYIVGYLFYFFKATDFVSFDPYMITHGQIWRVFSWVLMPPSAPGIASIIMLLFFFSIGTAMERTWGDFRYNLYIFSGIIFTIIAAFAMYFIARLGIQAEGVEYLMYSQALGYRIALCVTTYYISASVFLAFAATYPDVQVMLYFLIPIKIKWLGIIDLVYIFLQLLIVSWYGKIIILASLLNLIIFYFMAMSKRTKNMRRKSDFRKSMSRQRPEGNYKNSNGVISKHKCAVCGRTELDDPTLEFRFCSKCNGNYEYCQDHLFTHTHIK